MCSCLCSTDNELIEVTTLPAGSTVNLTFHVAYPHRVSLAVYAQISDKRLICTCWVRYNKQQFFLYNIFGQGVVARM